MLNDAPEKHRVVLRTLSIILALAVALSCLYSTSPRAYANFSSDSADQVIGVGRIQSSSTTPAEQPSSATHFEAPIQLVAEPVESVIQLAQPMEREIENPEGAIESVSLIQRFGEPDENGWWHHLATTYGPSDNGRWTALGTELTLTSMGVAVNNSNMDLLGRWIYISYGDVTLKVQIVDTGMYSPDGRIFDLQPGIVTAFGAPTPEFGWGVRWVSWRFAD